VVGGVATIGAAAVACTTGRGTGLENSSGSWTTSTWGSLFGSAGS
jgi:hypothetical protein